MPLLLPGSEFRSLGRAEEQGSMCGCLGPKGTEVERAELL